MFAEFGAGQGRGDVFVEVDVFEFGVHFNGGEAVELELGELLEGLGGAALVEGALLDEVFHLLEEVLVFGVLLPAVLGFRFEALRAEGLEGCEGLLLEDEFFGGAVGGRFAGRAGRGVRSSVATLGSLRRRGTPLRR